MSQNRLTVAILAKANELTAERLAPINARVRELEGELATARNQLSTAENTVTNLRNEVKRQETLVNRLEGLCNLRGVKPEEAIDPGYPQQAKESQAQWDKRLAEARTPAEKDRVTKAYVKAMQEGRVG